MNRLSLLAISFIICSPGLAFAVNVTPTPSKTTTASAATISSTHNNPNPITHQINQRLYSQWVEIQKGVQNGKITKAQSETFHVTLKSIRAQETAFFKQNGNHELTTAQQNQLNQSLETNAQTLTAAGLTPASTPTR